MDFYQMPLLYKCDRSKCEKHFRVRFGKWAPFKQTATITTEKMRINGTSVLFIDKVVYTPIFSIVLFTLLPISAIIYIIPYEKEAKKEEKV